jgi:hypothetical protein
LAWHETYIIQVTLEAIMRITKCRKRRSDSFDSSGWGRSIFDQPKVVFSLLYFLKEKDLVKLGQFATLSDTQLLIQNGAALRDGQGKISSK